MPTYGEEIVERLLGLLPPKEYFHKAEPTIINVNHANRSNPDFIVVGALIGVIVIEVKDWVKIVKINKTEVEIVRRDGTPATMQNPVIIARDYARNLATQFEKRVELVHKSGRHAGNLKFPWRWAVALPNVESRIIRQAEQKDIWDTGRVFGREDLTPEAFRQVLNNVPGGYKLEHSLDSNILDLIRGVIDPELIVVDTAGQDIGTLTRVQENEIRRAIVVSEPPSPKPLPMFGTELTTEAETLVGNTAVRLIRGVAGSGKSLVLARKACYLAEQYPDLSILVMTYNVDLAADLRKRIGENSNVEVIGFHKMCSRILGKQWRSPIDAKNWLKNNDTNLMQEAGLTTDFMADEFAYRKDLEIFDGDQYLEAERQGRGQALTKAKRVIINRIFEHYLQYQHKNGAIDWADVPQRAWAALTPGHPDWQHYDVILIDEAQDFGPSWIKVVRALLKPNGNLFMCDDPTQSIFRFTTWKQRGVEVAGRTRILRVPFRSTRSITEAAHGLIGADVLLRQADEIPQPDLNAYELPIGAKPLLVRCNSQHHEVKYIERKVKELIASGAAKDGIAILCHSKSIVDSWSKLRNEGVYVESFWKMKGLEFQSVFIPQIQGEFEHNGFELDDQTVSEVRRRIFTAMTRARNTLVMSYYGEFPEQLAAIDPYIQQEHSAA